MENIIDLLDKEEMVEFGYVGEYEPCHTAYALEDLTFCECQELASEVDFEIIKEYDVGNLNEVVYTITDCQGGWDWLEEFTYDTPQLALSEIERVLLDIGIAIIPKEDIEVLALVEQRVCNSSKHWDIEGYKKYKNEAKVNIAIADIGILNNITKDNIDIVLEAVQQAKKVIEVLK